MLHLNRTLIFSIGQIQFGENCCHVAVTRLFVDSILIKNVRSTRVAVGALVGESEILEPYHVGRTPSINLASLGIISRLG